ncbi:MAG: nucleotide exchange factor GrpE [Clostridiales bacterium]|jgi:molecular chaperone GrpE|nr:nucleotide exchange factor GrpE [Clostridiales bacterium]
MVKAGSKNEKGENKKNKDIDDMTTEETPDIIDPKGSDDEFEKLEKQNLELIDKLQRNLAEFDNYRKRSVKEKSDMFDIGAISVIEKILPVIDNFERAINAYTNKDDGMYKGIVMIYKQLDNSLRELGAEPIDCVGKKFDPNFHNAVAHEKNDEYEDNVIIEELQKGYMYKDKVIRPSMVKVAN